MTSSTTKNAIFEQAHQNFLSSLSPDEQSRFSKCQSADQLLSETKQLKCISNDRTHGRTFIARIKKFSDSLSPYFEVVGIAIQSNPEYAALVWGGIRLVLQLANNYTVFFDKFTSTLELISYRLPQHELVVNWRKSKHVSQFPKEIKASLEEIYVNIFKFLHGVARIFTKKNGKYKSAPRVMTSLAWEPFDIRFKDILDRIDACHSVLKDLMLLDQMQLDRDELERVEDERNKMEKERLQAEKGRDAEEIARAKSEAERHAILEKLDKLESTRLEKTEMQKQKFEDEEEENQKRYKAVRKRILESAWKKEFPKIDPEIADLKKDALVERIKTWISPPEFLLTYEDALRCREAKTGTWLLEESLFVDWKSSSPDRAHPNKFGKECLWVQGNLGSGKTVLAAAVVEELGSIEEDTSSTGDDASNTGSPPDVLHFFFRSGISSLDSATAAYRALLAQALYDHRKNNDLLDLFTFVMNEMSGGQMYASQDELTALLRLYMQFCGRCYVVLDAIDECIDHSSLVEELLRSKQNTGMMLLFFSRPNVVSLSWTVQTTQHLKINKKTHPDIAFYLRRKVKVLKEKAYLPPTADLEQLVEHLAIGADGMWLWARLMTTYLNSPALSRTQRLAVVENVTLPEGLEKMYMRILDLISQGYQAERDLARQIFNWLAFSQRELTVEELQLGIACGTCKEFVDETEPVDEFIHRVVMTCGGLVEPEHMFSTIHERASTFIRFIHLSVKEFFSNPSAEAPSSELSFSIINWESHADIAYSILQFLTFKLPAQPLRGEIGLNASPHHLYDAFPFASYSALHWIDHLHSMMFDISSIQNESTNARDYLSNLVQSLIQFLSQGFVLMAWIEASYIHQQPPNVKKLEEWWNWSAALHGHNFLQDFDIKQLREDILELCTCLKDLHEYWGPKLLASPACIWEEVTAFTPSRLLPQANNVKVHNLVKEEHHGDAMSTKYMCRVSESNPNGLLLSILTIWPSRRYQVFTQKNEKEISLHALHELSSGWMAHYEIWSLVDEPTTIISHKFSLDPQEVWLQMKHSMSYQPYNGGKRVLSWGMQFPMTIHSNLRLFTILRTLYSLKPAMSKSGLLLENTILDVKLEETAYHWVVDVDQYADRPISFELTSFGADERFRDRNIYLYWFRFHPDGRSIFFVGQNLQGPSTSAVVAIDHLEKMTTSLVNFALVEAQNALITSPEWSRDFNQVKVIFHHLHSLLGFTFAGYLYLWKFREVGLSPSPLCRIDPHPEIYFSECGKYVSFSERLEGRMIKHHIPDSFLPSRYLTVNMEYKVAGSSAVKQIKYRSRSPSLASPGRSVSCPKSPSKGFARPKSPLQVVKMEDNSVHLQRYNQQKLRTTSTELIKLPTWAADGKADVALQLPDDRMEKIKVILNKASQPWYGMHGEADQHLPAVVERDRVAVNLSQLGIEEKTHTLKAIENQESSGSPRLQIPLKSDDRPQKLATQFIESWNQSADSTQLALQPFLSQDNLIEDFAGWIRRQTQDPNFVQNDTIFRLLVSTGARSENAQLKDAANAVTSLRESFS